MVNSVQDTSQMDITNPQMAGNDRSSSSSEPAHSSHGSEVKTNMTMKQAVSLLLENPERRSRFIEAARRLCKGSPRKFDKLSSDDAYFRNVASALIKQSHVHGKRVWTRIITTISSTPLDGQKWKQYLDKAVNEFVVCCVREPVHEGASVSTCDLQSSAASSDHTLTNQKDTADRDACGNAGALSSESHIPKNVTSSEKSSLINSNKTEGGAVAKAITANAPVPSKTPESAVEFFVNPSAGQTSSPPLVSDHQRLDSHKLGVVVDQPPSPEEELPVLTPPRKRPRVGAWRVHVKAARADPKNPPLLTRANESPSVNSKNSSERSTSTPPPLIAYYENDTDKPANTLSRPLSPKEKLPLPSSSQIPWGKEALKGTKVSGGSSSVSSCSKGRPGCLEKVAPDARRQGCVENVGDTDKGKRKRTEQRTSGCDGDGRSILDKNYSQNEERTIWKSRGLQSTNVLEGGRPSGSQMISKHRAKLSLRKLSELDKVTTKSRSFTESQRKLPRMQEIGVHDRCVTAQVQHDSQSNVTDESRLTIEKRTNDNETLRHFMESDDCMLGPDIVAGKQCSKGEGKAPEGRKIAYVLPLAKEDDSEASCTQKRPNSPNIHERNTYPETEPILAEMPAQRMEEKESEVSIAPSSPSIRTTMHNAESEPIKVPQNSTETLWSSCDKDDFEDFSEPDSSSSNITLPYAFGRPVKFKRSDRGPNTRCKEQLTRDWVASLPDPRNDLPAGAFVDTVVTPKAVGVEKMGGCEFRFLIDGNQTWYVMADVEAAHHMEVRFLRGFGRVQARTCSVSEASILNSSIAAVRFKECTGGESQLMSKDSVDFVKKVKRAFTLLKPLEGSWSSQFKFPESVEQFFDIVSNLQEDKRGPVTSIQLPQDVILRLTQLLEDDASPQ